MIEERGPGFVQRMLDGGSEIAPHGYVHDLNKRHGGDKVYAGHYGPAENEMQINDGIQAVEKNFPGKVQGYRLPYGHMIACFQGIPANADSLHTSFQNK